jgi:hypothetical protein
MSKTKPPSPQDDGGARTDSSDSPLYVFDGPGDNTRRPARPNLPPPYWPGRGPLPPPKPPDEQPPAPGKA